MTAMTNKWRIFNLIGKRKSESSADNAKTRDPLDHPELARMTLLELADLPMPSYTCEN